MNKYLLPLLQEVNTVIIPGLGAVTVTSEQTGEMMFMSYLKFDDGVLIKHIATVENADKDDVKVVVTKVVEQIVSNLDSGSEYIMPKIGVIRKGDEDWDFEVWTEEMFSLYPSIDATLEEEEAFIQNLLLKLKHERSEKAEKENEIKLEKERLEEERKIQREQERLQEEEQRRKAEEALLARLDEERRKEEIKLEAERAEEQRKLIEQREAAALLERQKKEEEQAKKEKEEQELNEKSKVTLELGQFILPLFQESTTVIIPEFGAVTITSLVAMDMLFLPYLKFDDGSLVQEIMRQTGVSKELAKRQLLHTVSTIKSKLENNTSFEIDQIGTFYMEEGEIAFTQEELPLPEMNEDHADLSQNENLSNQLLEQFAPITEQIDSIENLDIPVASQEELATHSYTNQGIEEESELEILTDENNEEITEAIEEASFENIENIEEEIVEEEIVEETENQFEEKVEELDTIDSLVDEETSLETESTIFEEEEEIVDESFIEDDLNTIQEDQNKDILSAAEAFLEAERMEDERKAKLLSENLVEDVLVEELSTETEAINQVSAEERAAQAEEMRLALEKIEQETAEKERQRLAEIEAIELARQQKIDEENKRLLEKRQAELAASSGVEHVLFFKYVKPLFQDTNTVILPGLGALTRTSEVENDMMFMPYLRFDDGLLVDYIKNQENATKEEAKHITQVLVNDVKSLLENGESISLFPIGCVKMGEEELEFVRSPLADEENVEPSEEILEVWNQLEAQNTQFISEYISSTRFEKEEKEKIAQEEEKKKAEERRRQLEEQLFAEREELVLEAERVRLEREQAEKELLEKLERERLERESQRLIEEEQRLEKLLKEEEEKALKAEAERNELEIKIQTIQERLKIEAETNALEGYSTFHFTPYIHELFEEQNTVIIPELGAITLTSGSKREMMFMAYLKFDDGELTMHIAEKEVLTKAQAKTLVSNYIEKVKAELSEGIKYQLFEIGVLIQGEEEIEFTPWSEIIASENQVNTENRALFNIGSPIDTIITPVVSEDHLLEQEALRLEEERLAELKREEEENARIAAEQAEQEALRLEEERLAEIKREEEENARIAAEQAEQEALRLEEKRLAELKREEEENARIAAEQAEQEALRLEEERLAELKREEEENARIATEQAEQEALRLEEERLAELKHEEKENARIAAEQAEQEALRLEEERLAELKREEEENARIAAEQAEQEALRLEEERLAELKREEEENARIAAEQAEQEALRLEEERLAELKREEEENARIAAEQAEQEALRLEEERLAELKREEEEHARIAAEQAEQDALRLEEERLAELKREEEENARIAAEQAEQEDFVLEDADNKDELVASELAVELANLEQNFEHESIELEKEGLPTLEEQERIAAELQEKEEERRRVAATILQDAINDEEFEEEISAESFKQNDSSATNLSDFENDEFWSASSKASNQRVEVDNSSQKEDKKRRKLILWLSSAAAALVIIGMILFVSGSDDSEKVSLAKNTAENDVRTVLPEKKAKKEKKEKSDDSSVSIEESNSSNATEVSTSSNSGTTENEVPRVKKQKTTNSSAYSSSDESYSSEPVVKQKPRTVKQTTEDDSDYTPDPASYSSGKRKKGEPLTYENAYGPDDLIKNSPKKKNQKVEVIEQNPISQSTANAVTSASTTTSSSSTNSSLKNKMNIPSSVKTGISAPDASKPFHVMCGAYESEIYAIKRAKELMAQGLSNLIIGAYNGMYRVSLGGYKTKEDAEAALEKFKEKVPQAWFFKWPSR